MHALLERVFLPRLRTATPAAPATTAPCWTPAAARSPSPPTPTSCSPLFFPGGDIGTLAVNGTVNDLAMCGARPLALSRRLHPRGGAAARDARARGRLHGARCEGGGRRTSSPATPRSSTAARATASSSTRPASASSSMPSSSRPRACARATPSSSAATSAGTASPSWPCARGCASRAPSRATARRLPAPVLALLAAGHRDSLPARPDPRRPGHELDRDRGIEPAARRGRREPHRRSRRTSAARARSSGSIRSTSPTRAASSPSCRRRRPRPRWPSCATTPSARPRRASARSPRARRRW